MSPATPVRRRLLSLCRASLAALCWLLACGAARAGDQADDRPPPIVTDPGEKLSVSLLTFGPGSIYWERFGHNAILLQDGADAFAFNYGIFDFSQKNFALNFARGLMIYRMEADPLSEDLKLYTSEGRWVQRQDLRLLPQQRARLRDFLVWNVQPENRRYRYDYFLSNCSTRVRDALNQALDGALSEPLLAQATPATYRSDAVRLIWPDRVLALAMDLALGPDADRPLNQWQESFVPMALMQAVRAVRVPDANGSLQPLVSADLRILDSSMADPPAAPPDLRLTCALIGLALGALLCWSAGSAWQPARIAFAAGAGLFCLLCALGGLALAAIWGLTQHWAGWCNENLLLLNPLSLLLIPACVMAGRAGAQPRQYAAVAAWVLVVLALAALPLRWLPGLRQANLHWVLLFLPAHLGLALGLRRARSAEVYAGAAARTRA